MTDTLVVIKKDDIIKNYWRYIMEITQCTPDQFLHEIEQVPQQYLPQLFEIIHIYKESIAKKAAVDSFEQSWQQAVSGETSPVSELWEGIDA